VSLRVQTSSKFARVTVMVQPMPEHRGLVINGEVLDDEGAPTWSRSSFVQLDGYKSRMQHVIEWHPSPGMLQVRADVIGVCGSAQGAAFVGW